MGEDYYWVFIFKIGFYNYISWCFIDAKSFQKNITEVNPRGQKKVQRINHI